MIATRNGLMNPTWISDGIETQQQRFVTDETRCIRLNAICDIINRSLHVGIFNYFIFLYTLLLLYVIC